MGVHRPLRMVGGIFHSLNRGSFEGLIGIGEFGYAFLVRVFAGGEALRVAGLSGAVRSHFARIVAQFVESRFMALRTAVGFAFFVSGVQQRDRAH